MHDDRERGVVLLNPHAGTEWPASDWRLWVLSRKIALTCRSPAGYLWYVVAALVVIAVSAPIAYLISPAHRGGIGAGVAIATWALLFPFLVRAIRPRKNRIRA